MMSVLLRIDMSPGTLPFQRRTNKALFLYLKHSHHSTTTLTLSRLPPPSIESHAILLQRIKFRGTSRRYCTSSRPAKLQHQILSPPPLHTDQTNNPKQQPRPDKLNITPSSEVKATMSSQPRNGNDPFARLIARSSARIFTCYSCGMPRSVVLRIWDGGEGEGAYHTRLLCSRNVDCMRTEMFERRGG